jgi:cyclic pyranopterin phosphate synthase
MLRDEKVSISNLGPSSLTGGLKVGSENDLSLLPDRSANDQERWDAIEKIERKLKERSESLADAINRRSLYFRISLVGACNLRCPFCHNEGASLKGIADIQFIEKVLPVVRDVGFRRVQFTGGEPLLHPKVAQFVGKTRNYFHDVGVTTNGTYLLDHLSNLIDNKITRIHISLQSGELQRWGDGGGWGIPSWLGQVLTRSAQGDFLVRLNMPVPSDQVQPAFRFLGDIEKFGCDVKVFAILPEGVALSQEYPLAALRCAVDRENERRDKLGSKGRILIRDFSIPSGVRCGSCAAYRRCKEQSRSLRLGADGMLRPCLATRKWDSSLGESDIYQKIRDASLLAIDYI